MTLITEQNHPAGNPPGDRVDRVLASGTIRLDAPEVKDFPFPRMEADMSLKASDIMTHTVVTVGPDDTVKAIAGALCGHDVSAVPVCDNKGVLVGIVSEGDLMQPFGAENTLKRAWWLNLLAEGDDLAPEFLEYVRMDHRCARDLMTTTVITASEDTPIPELADLMTRHRIKRVPIMRGDRLVGVVSRSDIVRTLIDTAAAVTRAA
jgi:CBS domain-containing protein